MKHNASRTAGILCALTGGILWGFSGCLGQYLFTREGVSAEWLTPLRLTFSGLILFVFSLVRSKKECFRIFKEPRDLVRLLLYGIAGLMFCQFSYLKSIELTNAATATVIQYLGPVLIMLYVCLKDRRLPAPTEAIAVVMAVGGTFLIATHGNPRTLVLSPAGLTWCLLSAFSVMLYTMLPASLVPRYGAPTVNGFAMLAGGLVLAGLTNLPARHQTLTPGVLIGLGGIVLLGTVLAFTLYIIGVAAIGPVKASLIASVEPVSSAVISALWLKTSFRLPDLIGFMLILAAVFFLSFDSLHKKV